MKKDFAAAIRETICKFEPGQLAYSQEYGPCLYIITDQKAADAANSICRIKPLIHNEADVVRGVKRKSLRHPPKKAELVEMIEHVRSKGPMPVLAEPEGIKAILQQGDFQSIAGLLRPLRAFTNLNTPPELTALYNDALTRVAGTLAAYVLTRQAGSKQHEKIKMGPATLAPFAEKIARRLQVAMSDDLTGESLDIFFAYADDPRFRSYERFVTTSIRGLTIQVEPAPRQTLILAKTQPVTPPPAIIAAAAPSLPPAAEAAAGYDYPVSRWAVASPRGASVGAPAGGWPYLQGRNFEKPQQEPRLVPKHHPLASADCV